MACNAVVRSFYLVVGCRKETNWNVEANEELRTEDDGVPRQGCDSMNFSRIHS